MPSAVDIFESPDAADAPVVAVEHAPSRLVDFYELTKPRMNFLVVITTMVGYYMAARTVDDWARVLATLIGTALTAAGSSVFNQYSERGYDALMIAGGRAPEYLWLDKRLIAIVRLFAAEKKPIAAICHAAQVLAAADVIRGRQVSGYAACAPEVRLAGGEYVATPPDGAIRDGNLVTGFAWPAHPQFLALFLEVLGTRVSL